MIIKPFYMVHVVDSQSPKAPIFNAYPRYPRYPELVTALVAYSVLTAQLCLRNKPTGQYYKNTSVPGHSACLGL